jgi:hypothetical protein
MRGYLDPDWRHLPHGDPDGGARRPGPAPVRTVRPLHRAATRAHGRSCGRRRRAGARPRPRPAATAPAPMAVRARPARARPARQPAERTTRPRSAARWSAPSCRGTARPSRRSSTRGSRRARGEASRRCPFAVARRSPGARRGGRGSGEGPRPVGLAGPPSSDRDGAVGHVRGRDASGGDTSRPVGPAPGSPRGPRASAGSAAGDAVQLGPSGRERARRARHRRPGPTRTGAARRRAVPVGLDGDGGGGPAGGGWRGSCPPARPARRARLLTADTGRMAGTGWPPADRSSAPSTNTRVDPRTARTRRWSSTWRRGSWRSTRGPPGSAGS